MSELEKEAISGRERANRIRGDGKQCQTEREEVPAEVGTVLWRNSKFRVMEHGEPEWTTVNIIN